jgi:excisionase family DNA binding protein
MDGLTRHNDDRGATLPRDRPPRLLLTVEEAAERIGICRAYMFKLIRQGDVRSVKVGRLRRVTPAALEDFVERLSGDSDFGRKRA